MPDLLPGKKPPKSVFEAERDAVAALDAAGPDPGLEEADDGDEIVEGGASASAPAAAPQVAASSQSAPQPASQVAPDQPAAPPAAAPAAAAPAEDPWADYEEIEYDDVDSGEKYIVRAPKKYAPQVKRGYTSQSFADRRLSAFGRNKAWIEPLIANGSFDRLAPVLQQIFAQPDLQDGMADLLNRKAAGLPLKFIDAAAAQAERDGSSAPQAPAAATSAAPVFDEAALRATLAKEGYDDYTINATVAASKAAIEPIARQFGSLQSTVQQQQQTYEEQRAQAEQQRQNVQRMQYIGGQARQTLMSWYPNDLNEQTPPATWNAIEAYARNSGLIDQMGFNVGAFTTAYMRMRETGLIRGDAQTLAPSAAVNAVAQAEAQARATAAAAANGVAAATAAPRGVGVAPEPRPTPPPAPPRTRKLSNGKEVPLTPTETARWIEEHSPRRRAG